jgi:hypothetical protein
LGFTIEFKGQVPEQDIGKEYFKVVEAIIQDFLDLVLKYALENLKRNESWVTGHLAKSGRVEISKTMNYIEGELLFGAPYAAYVEFGTRPHAAPLGPSLEVDYQETPSGKFKGYKPMPYRKVTKERKIMGITVARELTKRATRVPDPTTNPLDYWAWRKGQKKIIKCYAGGRFYGFHLELAWRVWLKILARGSDPHPYLRPAIAKAERELPRLVRKHVHKVDTAAE